MFSLEVLTVKKLMNFLDIVVRDYEALVRSNHEKEQHIKKLRRTFVVF